MDTELYALVGKYGFKAVHTRLDEIMREEYDYMRVHFKNTTHAALESPVVVQDATLQDDQPDFVQQSESVKKTKQVKKKEQKKVEVKPEPEPEVKDVLVTVPEKSQFRDPKEVREFQKAAEEAKRKENEAAGIQLVQILTKENLKKWIEEEGRTYAWVAREKAGCADTQVAAQAQMMGLTSKITKKRGMIMANRK